MLGCALSLCAQCLVIVLLVLHVDDGGVVVGCGLFVATLLGYLVTQLRVHPLTLLVSSDPRRRIPPLRCSRSCRLLPCQPLTPAPVCHLPHPLRQCLCVNPVVMVLELVYCGYCLVSLRLGLFGHHSYAFLHLVSCVVLAVCEWVEWSLYRQEEVTEEWARQEEELDDLIAKSTSSEHLRLTHRSEHRDSDSCFV